jgi:hypothetical protein
MMGPWRGPLGPAARPVVGLDVTALPESAGGPAHSECARLGRREVEVVWARGDGQELVVGGHFCGRDGHSPELSP